MFKTESDRMKERKNEVRRSLLQQDRWTQTNSGRWNVYKFWKEQAAIYSPNLSAVKHLIRFDADDKCIMQRCGNVRGKHSGIRESRILRVTQHF